MADIGSLVIKLAAETADFREDLGKSALLLERHAESMRGSLEKVAEVAKTTFAIAIGVESVGALKELVMHTLETVAALQDLAEQTGASATALSGFAPVATISGVAMEQIGVGLTKLSKGLAGVDDETKGASQALQFLGIKAKDAGGKVDVAVVDKGSVTEVRVENTGSEIDPQVLPRLFDRFFRADPARSHPESDGAGLGLSITKAIAEIHGGTATVTSNQGRTRFSLQFPHSINEVG
jgi:hypothetical protein